MNQRDADADAWDIISSTFNDDILETLNQSVSINLEDTNHLVVVREFPINHLIPLLKEISPADMSGQGYMSSESVVTNLRETGRIIPVTRDETIKMSTKVSKVLKFESCPPPEDHLGPILKE